MQMAVPLLKKAIVKKRVKHFKRAHSDRYIGLKVRPRPLALAVARAASLPEPRHFSRWITLGLVHVGFGRLPDLLC